jgi:hypothetical protein
MKNSSWITASIAVLAAVIALTAVNFPRFPFFLDIYYHLNVMRGFDAAGGIVGRAFWELAPIGQPLLYPPIFHLLLLALYKTGIGILAVARLASVLPVIVLFAVIFIVTCKLHSAKRAFFTLLAVCIPYSFFLKMTITVPVTVSLIFIVLAFFALERRRIAACSIFLALVFYTHLALPWMACAAFILYGLFEKKARRDALSCVLFAICLSVPQLIHTASNINRLAGPLGIPMPEGKMFEIYPIIYLLAAVDIAKANSVWGMQGKRIRLFSLSLLIGFLPLAFNYGFRYISAEGMFPVLLLAGAGLEYIYDLLKGLFRNKLCGGFAPVIYTFIFCVLFTALCPTISSYVPSDPPYDRHEFSAHLSDSTIVNLVPALKTHVRPFEISMADDLAKSWAETIKANTSKDDIICSNDALVGGMLSALSGRANSARTFFEVKEPDVPISEFGAAKTVVWIRESNGKFSSEINDCILKFGYTVICMDEGAAILIKESGAKVSPVKPVMGTPLALLALLTALTVAFLGISRP